MKKKSFLKKTNPFPLLLPHVKLRIKKNINLHPPLLEQSKNKLKQLTLPPSTIKSNLQKLQIVKKLQKVTKSEKKSTKTT